MVWLVMRPTRQKADEAETANVLDFLRISRGDDKQFTIRQRLRFGSPAVEAVYGLLDAL